MEILVQTISPFQQRASIPDHREAWEMEFVSWIGLHKLFVILICDHQEKHNKDELTRGAGGRIKEVEEHFLDGEKLRTQEEIHQKASAGLSDKVSIIVMYESGYSYYEYTQPENTTCTFWGKGALVDPQNREVHVWRPIEIYGNFELL